MKTLLKPAVLALLLLTICRVSAQSYKTDFYVAYEFLDDEKYGLALEAFLDIDKKYDGNANVRSIIGYCYLQSQYEKNKAIFYYEDCQEHLTAYYKAKNHKEKNAPVEVVWFLGKAYHANYQFDEAIAKYSEYKEVLNVDNTEAIEAINRDLRLSRNAKKLYDNPVHAELHALNDAINTKYPDYRPIITADESLLFFTSRRHGSMGGQKDDEDGAYREDVYVSAKTENGWGEPKPIDELNLDGHEACIYVSPDGQHMFLYKFDEIGGGTIYESYLQGEAWSEPKPLEAEINSEYWDSHAGLSADGSVIVFVSDRPGGVGGRDIYLMKKLPNGAWANVQNIGNTVNTPFDEEGPYLHPDGKTLYFSSQGHDAMGGFDVFASELQADGSWSEPRNLGYPINTVGEDVFFIPTADGTRAFFSSYREDGKGDQDIYMIDMLDEKKKVLIVYKGCIKDQTGAVVTDVLISVYDRKTDDIIGEYKANKSTGRFLIVLNPGEYTIEYEYKGLIADENIDVATDEEYHEVGRLITKSDIKLELQEIEADCEGIQIVSVADTNDWTYQLIVEDVIYGGADVEVLNPNKELVYQDLTNEFGEFRYEAILPKDQPFFRLKLHDPALCGKAKIILIDGNDNIVKEYTSNITCRELAVVVVEPGTFQKFYGYNKRGVTAEERELTLFVEKAVAIFEQTGKLTLNLEGCASSVPTKTFKTNRSLAAKRLEDGELAIKTALEARGIAFDRVIVNRKSGCHGPYYKGDFETGAEKYGKFQFFKASVK